MKILGITGGSGTGKTSVANIFRNNGFYVCDSDKVAREVVEPGKPALSELCDCFGDILLPNGKLDRKRLADIAFSDKNALNSLNSITHKYITAEIWKRFEKTNEPLVCVDGAALIESGINEKCDFLLSVLAERTLRATRIQKRDGLTPDEAQKRINAQKTDSYYIEKSDFIVYNNGNEKDLERSTQKIIDRLRGML